MPGFGIGPLHLGMTVLEANKAAKQEHLSPPSPFSDGSKIQIGFYAEGDTSVETIFRNGSLAVMIVGADRHFITSTGITTFGLLSYDPPNPWVIPGSTKLDFEHSGKSVSCSDYPGSSDKQVCVYEDPKTRYTVASTAYETCSASQAKQGCNWPAPDWYINGLGVATDKGWRLYKTLSHLP